MALLSQMFRTVAITGRTDSVNAWFADRQGGRWAEQTVAAAFPQVAPNAQQTPPAPRDPAPTDPAEALGDLRELHQRGVITDTEFEDLRAGLRV